MGIIDQWRLKKLEKERGPIAPPSGYSWGEIRNNAIKSELFRKMLVAEGHADIAKNLAKDNLENDYPDFLEQLKIFSERMVRAEKVEGLLTTESIRDIALSNPDFAKITGSLGLEKVLETVRGQLKHIATTDEDRFNLIAGSIENRESYKTGEYRKIHEKVEKLLNDNQITPEEYSEALAIADPAEKKKALEGLVTKTYGGFEKALNWVSRGYLSKDIVKGLQDSGTPFEESMSRLNVASGSLGHALFLSINENAKMRKASYSSQAQEKPSGFMEAQREAASLDEDQLKKDWKAKKRTVGNWSQLAQAVQNDLKEKFLTEQKGAYKEKMEKKGGWHAFFAALIEALFDDKADELKGKLE